MLRKVSLSSVLIVIIIPVCLSFLLLYNFNFSNEHVLDELFNFGHLPLFGVLALIILWIMTQIKWPRTLKTRYTLAGFFSLILGMIFEVLQIFTPGRFFEVNDILYDAIGALLFLTFTYPFPLNTSKTRMIIRTLCLVGILTASYSIPLALADQKYMQDEFPIIASFETRFERSRWRYDDAEMSISSLHVTHGCSSMKLSFDIGTRPGVSLKYLPDNWKGYDIFSFDMFLEENNPLIIKVRITDRSFNGEYLDRFEKRFSLTPGQNHLFISMKDIEAGPKYRSMDMGNISSICIYTYSINEPKTVYLDNLRLVKITNIQLSRDSASSSVRP